MMFEVEVHHIRGTRYIIDNARSHEEAEAIAEELWQKGVYHDDVYDDLDLTAVRVTRDDIE
jgi:hypothetical protein